jgi:hypothetical protein
LCVDFREISSSDSIFPKQVNILMHVPCRSQALFMSHLYDGVTVTIFILRMFDGVTVRIFMLHLFDGVTVTIT